MVESSQFESVSMSMSSPSLISTKDSISDSDSDFELSKFCKSSLSDGDISLSSSMLSPFPLAFPYVFQVACFNNFLPGTYLLAEAVKSDYLTVSRDR